MGNLAQVRIEMDHRAFVADHFHTDENLPHAYSSDLVQFVVKLLDDWKLNLGDAVHLLGYEKQDIEYVDCILREIEPLRGRDVKFRISKLFCIRHSLWNFFQNLDAENEWLREPQSMLDGEIPLAMIQSGRIDKLMLLEEHIDMIAGM